MTVEEINAELEALPPDLQKVAAALYAPHVDKIPAVVQIVCPNCKGRRCYRCKQSGFILASELRPGETAQTRKRR